MPVRLLRRRHRRGSAGLRTGDRARHRRVRRARLPGRGWPGGPDDGGARMWPIRYRAAGCGRLIGGALDGGRTGALPLTAGWCTAVVSEDAAWRATAAIAAAVGQRAAGSLAIARSTIARTAGGMSPGSGRGCVPDVLHGDLDRGGAVERPAPGQALVGHHAERVDVGGGGGDRAGGLLGRDVGGGAEHRTGRGELADHGGPGDAEVGQHERAVRAYQQVARLDVAVHDAVLVCGLQRVGGLRDQRHRAGRGEPADPAQRARQRVALDVLHDQEGELLVAAVVVDVDDAGVVDGGHGAGLAAEPLGEAGLVQQGGQQDLDRDRTAEHLVGAAPDVAHAAAGDPLVEPVAAAEGHSRADHLSPLPGRPRPS